MTSDPGSGRDTNGSIDEADIVRFLEMRPDFLARHAFLYLTLAPPARVHGEQVADHMAAMLAAARRQNVQLQDNVRRRRAGRSLGDRVEHALLGLIRASDPIEWLEHELAATLGIDAAHLCLEGDASRASVRPLGGLAARLMGGRDIVFRETITEGAALHGPAADLVRRDVLVRIQPNFGPTGVLALGSRDEGLPGPGSEGALALLRAALEAALDRA